MTPREKNLLILLCGTLFLVLNVVGCLNNLSYYAVDDNCVVAERLRLHHSQESPVLKYFRDRGVNRSMSAAAAA